MPKKEKRTTIPTKKHLARMQRERIQRRNILIATIAILVVVVGLVGYGLLDNLVLIYNQPVAQVGSQVFTVRDYQTQTKFQRYQMIQQFNQYYSLIQQFQGDPFGLTPQLQDMETQLSQPSVMGKNVVDQMVSNAVVMREAQKRGITVTDAEVDEYIQKLYGYFPNGTPTPTITPTIIPSSTYSSTQLALITLTPTPTPGPSPTPTNTPTDMPTATPGAGTPTAIPPTATQVPTSTQTPTVTPTGPTATATVTETPTITETPTPYTEDLYKGQVSTTEKNWATIQFTDADFRQLVRYQIYRDKLTEAFVKAAPTTQEQIWARTILVADEATANTIETKLKSGEDFGTLAKTSSTDTTSKDSGGDLGWFAKGKMPQAFDDAAFKMNIGDISAPVKTDSGYYIIQLLGKETKQLSNDEIRTQGQTDFQTWLTTATTASDVHIYDAWTSHLVTDPPFNAPDLSSLTQPQVQPNTSLPTTTP
jgi:peptidyl-prolyl cis-trans isomerase D